jgi:hypothetical protein
MIRKIVIISIWVIFRLLVRWGGLSPDCDWDLANYDSIEANT